MLRVLSFLLSGCWHKWSGPIATVDLFTPDESIPSGRILRQQCERCGKIRSPRETY